MTSAAPPVHKAQLLTTTRVCRGGWNRGKAPHCCWQQATAVTRCPHATAAPAAAGNRAAIAPKQSTTLQDVGRAHTLRLSMATAGAAADVTLATAAVLLLLPVGNTCLHALRCCCWGHKRRP